VKRRVNGPAALRDLAARIADDVLFPAAMAVDAADRVPAGHLDLLAAEGLYGLAGPPERGGLGAGPATACRVIETLAGGCLATAFVWLQHHGVVRAVAADGAGGPGATWLEPLCRGERRAGVALGGTLPGSPLRARPVRGGYLLDGLSPWVTGWDLIDVVHVAARDPRDNIVMALLDAEAGQALSAQPLHMVAVNASRTVQLRFDGQFVAADRVTGITPHRGWQAADVMRLRPNGSLALGVAARCCRLIGPSPLDGELAARRAALDSAADTIVEAAVDSAAHPARAGLDADAMPAARADAAEFAARAAAALVAAAGSRGILAGEHPQRLARESLFLLVFGSRPAIKERLVSRLTATTR
jgi:alkylation response protein AidB-like acyl-CoA dehydrogenase